jgi:hypothetical protein
LTDAFAAIERVPVALVLPRDAIEALAASEEEQGAAPGEVGGHRRRAQGTAPGRVSDARQAPRPLPGAQGDWRAIFSFDGADVVVERIGNRGEVCR